ncbi:ATP-binding protein [Streptomyces sp. TLI_146]|uniref:ATP-binding protein n=1 Tax=Streptomyces sp. TLI_146 TaxID=1938858 RepID=UPI000C7048F9|nr:ATP-binding protein [Streptomyces sp. TLI_146]PKV83012.1 histidine kinase-like protein [Streptomyces sp. TLI_146]
MRSAIRPVCRHILRSSPIYCLPLDPGSAGAARGYVHAFLGGARRDALEEDSLLIVSELVTNAVRHGAGPVWFCLRHVTQSDGAEALHVLVGDHGSGCDRDAGATVEATDSTSGRGLCIVDALASSWGSTQAQGHHIMWASLEIMPSSGASSQHREPCGPVSTALAAA